MKSYPKPIEKQIVQFYHSLNERDSRRYAGIEASKLGHGGLEYISKLLNCDQKTIRKAQEEFQTDEALPIEGQRKKGVAEKA